MDKILGWVFKGYKRRLDENLQQEIRMFKASVDIRDIVRERLKGIKPGRPDEDKALYGKIASMGIPERLEFLSKAHTIVSDNTTFKTVCDYLLFEAMRKAAQDSVDIIEVNFQRATMNGIMLLEDELTYLSGLYVEEKKLAEAMTLEERLEVI